MPRGTGVNALTKVMKPYLARVTYVLEVLTLIVFTHCKYCNA